MIHPHTEPRHTGTDVGLGVFATALIPRGTIVYVMDSLEIVLPRAPWISPHTWGSTVPSGELS